MGSWMNFNAYGFYQWVAVAGCAKNVVFAESDAKTGSCGNLVGAEGENWWLASGDDDIRQHLCAPARFCSGDVGRRPDHRLYCWVATQFFVLLFSFGAANYLFSLMGCKLMHFFFSKLWRKQLSPIRVGFQLTFHFDRVEISTKFHRGTFFFLCKLQLANYF